MASHFGFDLSQVRIHEGPRADAAVRSVGARAFTLGSSIAFAERAYQPDTAAGRHLLAHELAHVAEPGPAGLLHRAPPTGEDKKDPIVEGLKTVGKKLKDKKEVKEKIIKPVETYAKKKWEGLSPEGKGGLAFTGGFVGGAYVSAITTMMALDGGRKKLSDFDILLPTSILPYNPAKSFIFTLPETKGGRLDLKFKLDFGDLLKVGRRDAQYFTALSVDGSLGYTASSNTWKVDGLFGTVQIAPWLSITGGYKQGLVGGGLGPLPKILPDGSTMTSVQSVPAAPGPAAPFGDRPNAGAVITFDLMKLKF